MNLFLHFNNVKLIVNLHCARAPCEIIIRQLKGRERERERGVRRDDFNALDNAKSELEGKLIFRS